MSLSGCCRYGAKFRLNPSLAPLKPRQFLNPELSELAKGVAAYSPALSTAITGAVHSGKPFGPWVDTLITGSLMTGVINDYQLAHTPPVTHHVKTLGYNHLMGLAHTSLKPVMPWFKAYQKPMFAPALPLQPTRFKP
jgi:hypothetical protein